MAERAVLTRRRPDRRYDVLDARWGATDRALAAVDSGVPPELVEGIDWHRRPDPLPFRRLVATLDYLSTELVYRTDRGDTTVFLPVWFGLPLADTLADPTAGALVSVESLTDVRTLRAGFRTLKAGVADALLAGTLAAPAAPLVICAAIGALSGRERYVAPLSSVSCDEG